MVLERQVHSVGSDCSDQELAAQSVRMMDEKSELRFSSASLPGVDGGNLVQKQVQLLYLVLSRT